MWTKVVVVVLCISVLAHATSAGPKGTEGENSEGKSVKPRAAGLKPSSGNNFVHRQAALGALTGLIVGGAGSKLLGKEESSAPSTFVGGAAGAALGYYLAKKAERDVMEEVHMPTRTGPVELVMITKLSQDSKHIKALLAAAYLNAIHPDKLILKGLVIEKNKGMDSRGDPDHSAFMGDTLTTDDFLKKLHININYAIAQTQDDEDTLDYFREILQAASEKSITLHVEISPELLYLLLVGGSGEDEQLVNLVKVKVEQVVFIVKQKTKEEEGPEAYKVYAKLISDIKKQCKMLEIKFFFFTEEMTQHNMPISYLMAKPRNRDFYCRLLEADEQTMLFKWRRAVKNKKLRAFLKLLVGDDMGEVDKLENSINMKDHTIEFDEHKKKLILELASIASLCQTPLFMLSYVSTFDTLKPRHLLGDAYKWADSIFGPAPKSCENLLPVGKTVEMYEKRDGLKAYFRNDFKERLKMIFAPSSA